MNKKIIALIIGILVVGGTFFYGGMKYAQSQISSMRGQFAAGNFAGGQRGVRTGSSGGGSAVGEIISKDDKSITLKLQASGSKIVFLSDKTPITKNVSGSYQDLVVNAQVAVTGTANPDGSISATLIQIRPAMIANQN